MTIFLLSTGTSHNYGLGVNLWECGNQTLTGNKGERLCEWDNGVFVFYSNSFRERSRLVHLNGRIK